MKNNFIKSIFLALVVMIPCAFLVACKKEKDPPTNPSPELKQEIELEGLLYQGKEDVDEYIFMGLADDCVLVNITIPDDIDGFPVTEIAEDAFYPTQSQPANVTSITIGDNVKKIGDYAFFGNQSIQNIKIGKGVEEIGQQVFANSKNIVSVMVDEENEKYRSENNAIITKDDNVLVHGSNACTSIPSGVTEIADRAFYRTINDFDNQVTLEIPNTVTRIGRHAFYRCIGINEIEFEENSQLKEIDEGAFFMNVGENYDGMKAPITEIRLPNSVESLGVNAFANNFNMTEIDLGDGIKTIGQSAFIGCSSLEDIKYNGKQVGSSLESIGNSAFSTCPSLSFVRVPLTIKNLGNIGKNIALNDVLYSYNYQTEKFTCCGLVEGSTAQSIAIENRIAGKEVVAIQYVGSNNSFDKNTNLKSITIKDGIELLTSFEGCTSLETIRIGSGVKEIPTRAFYGCTSLRNVDLTNATNLTKIADNAFYNCSSLENISLPDTVLEIGIGAFRSSGLTSIDLNNVTTIRNQAFASTAVALDLSSSKVTTLENPGCQIHYNGYKFSYAADNKLICIGFSDGPIADVVIPSQVASRQVKQVDYATDFSEKDKKNVIKSVVIPDGISLTRTSFDNCKLLETVVLGNGVKSLPTNAFLNCSALKSVSTSSLEAIGLQAFFNCTSLETFEFPSTLKSIGKYAFKTSGLKEAILNKGIENIGEAAFAYCYSLEKIYLPSSIKTISIPTDGTISLYPFYFAGMNVQFQIKAYLEDTKEGCDLPDGWNFVTAENNITDITYGVQNPEHDHNFSGILHYEIHDGILYSFYSCDCGAKAEYRVVEYAVVNGLKAELVEGKEEFVITGLENATITDVVIPNDIDGIAITEIAYEAFASTETINSLTIGDNVKTIGGFAFYNCDNLASVIIGAGVETIGEEAFSHSSGTTSLTVKENNPIYYSANNAVITKVDNVLVVGSVAATTIPEGVTKIGAKAYYGTFCTDSAEYVLNIPASVKIIEDHAFYRPTSLKAINFAQDSQLESIGKQAFSGYINEKHNTKLTSISFPSNLTYIGVEAFANHNSLLEIKFNTLGNLTLTLADRAFTGCRSLTTLDLGNAGKVFGTQVFRYAALTEITLKNVLDSGSHVFRENASLTKVIVGSGVSSIGQYMFYQCSALETVDFSNTDTSFITIGSNAFYSCTKLKNTIGSESFVIPASVKTIEDNAFFNCDLIENFVFIKAQGVESYAIETIGNGAFAYADGIKSIWFPSSVKSVGKTLFTACRNLIAVCIEADSIETVGENWNNNFAVKTNFSYEASLYVVAESNGLTFELNKVGDNFEYTAIKVVDTTRTDIVFEDTINGFDVTAIKDKLFASNKTITSVQFGKNIKSIGYQSFYNCDNVTSFTFVEGSILETIGGDAFAFADGFTTIRIPQSVKEIGTNAFWQTAKLALIEISINSDRTNWGDYNQRSAKGWINVEYYDHEHSNGNSNKYIVKDGKAYIQGICTCGEEIQTLVENAVIATPSTAQAVLDSNINGKIVVFDGEFTEDLHFRPTRTSNSIIMANYGSNANNNIGPTEYEKLPNTGFYYYQREIKDVKFVSTEGTVLKGLLNFDSRWYNETSIDPMRTVTSPVTGTYTSILKLENLEFNGLEFEGAKGRIYIRFTADEAKADNIVVDGCSFETTTTNSGTTSEGATLYIYRPDVVGEISNIVYKNNYVDGHKMGIYVTNANNISLIGNTVKNTLHNAFGVQSVNGYTTGTVTIENNEIIQERSLTEHTTDRAIRFSVMQDATVVVRNNTITNFVNSVDCKNEVIKTGDFKGSSTLTFENNKYYTTAGDEFDLTMPIVVGKLYYICELPVGARVEHNVGENLIYEIVEDKVYSYKLCSCGTKVEYTLVENAVIATPDNAQAVLDSNINGKVVVFAPGEYNDILELSPTRETVTIYEAVLEDGLPTTGEPSSTIVPLDEIVESKYYVYERNYENITFVGTEGALFKNTLILFNGSARGYYSLKEEPERYDPIKDDYDWPVGMTSNYAFYMLQNFKDLTFMNMNFEGAKGRIFFQHGYKYTKQSENLTIKNCTFVTDVPNHSTNETQGSSWDAAIRIGTAYVYEYDETTGYDKTKTSVVFKNVVIENNTVDKHFIGIYVQAANGIKISNNIVKNTEDVGISIQPSDSKSSIGVIQIADNTIDTTSNRAIRIANCEDATITVEDNTLKNIVTLDDQGSLVKLSSLTGCTFTFENNTINGKEIPPIEDKTLSAYNIKEE